MDLNTNLLKRRVEYYEEIRQLSSKDIFTVKYKPTGDTFALRKTDLKEYSDLELFENESNLTNRLKHQNLMPFITSFITNSELWTVMPFAEFQSLADLSTPYGFAEEAIALAMKDVLQAVQYLHNNCIIHNSIRSSHILLFGSPETEFRCILSGLKYAINTIRKGQIVTPVFDYPIRTEVNVNWLAPEVLEQNLMGYDIKADIYSIGITCCELSNGEIPFDSMPLKVSEAADILLQKLNGESPEPLDCNSKDLKQIIETELEETIKPLTRDQKIIIRRKYESFLNRKFSKHFKRFTKTCCLHLEPEKRFNSLQLLEHPFIKKYENLDKTKVFIESIRKNKHPEEINKFV